MPGFNRSGPHGEGPMTGRRMGRCNPNHERKTKDELGGTRVGFVSALIISAARLVWIWIREKHLKEDLK